MLPARVLLLLDLHTALNYILCTNDSVPPLKQKLYNDSEERLPVPGLIKSPVRSTKALPAANMSLVLPGKTRQPIL